MTACPRHPDAGVTITSVAMRGIPMPDGSYRDTEGHSACCKTCGFVWPLTRDEVKP